MSEYIPDFVLSVYHNTLLAGLLYWLPLFFCAFGYLIRTGRNAQKDLANRAAVRTGSQSYYHPTDKVGTLIGRAVVSILPVGNLLAAIFDVAPEVFGRFLDWLGRVFDQPLVPKDSP